MARPVQSRGPVRSRPRTELGDDPVAGAYPDEVALQDILEALAEDMPTDAELELQEYGIGDGGEAMSRGDVLYDGSFWDPDRPPRSQIPAKDWLD